MTALPTLPDLIAALKMTEGPSRELDADVDQLAYENGWRGERIMIPDTTPFYTASIDAALTLFDERPEVVDTDPRKACIAALEARTK